MTYTILSSGSCAAKLKPMAWWPMAWWQSNTDWWYWGFVLKWEREIYVLFNDALNTFYLRLYGVRHMVKDHSDSEKGNPLPPNRLLFPINTYHGLYYTSHWALSGTRNRIDPTTHRTMSERSTSELCPAPRDPLIAATYRPVVPTDLTRYNPWRGDSLIQTILSSGSCDAKLKPIAERDVAPW